MTVKTTTTSPISEQFGILLGGTPDIDISNLDRKEIIELFTSSSLLLFRSFNVTTETFKAFTELFSTNFASYVGGAYSRETINGDKTLLSVTGGKQKFAVPLHGEMYYRKQKPDIIWFYCATPAVKDGETTVCDGIQLYNELSDSTRELLHQKRLKYIRTYPDGVWQKIYQTDDLSVVEKLCHDNDMQLTVSPERAVTTEYVVSAIRESRCGKHKVFINNILPVVAQERQGSNASLVRFEDHSKIPDEVISEIKEVSDRLTYAVSWQKGDILMVDNTRLLHGRRSFADTQRDIYVRLGNADFSF